jgi:uncharacterized repeat protein (TIGR01451 family)
MKKRSVNAFTNLLVLTLIITLAAAPGKAQMVTTYAGNGTIGVSGNGGPATAAQLSFAFAATFDAAGNLYLGMPDAVRKISPAGIITNFAGNGTAGYTGDGGLAVNAEVANVEGIALDAAGNLYFSVGYSPASVVRKVDLAGVITTVVGSPTSGPGFSGDGGLAVNAQLSQPRDIAFDAAGNMYIIDAFNARVRKVDVNGIITTIAGNGSPAADAGDGGLAVNASFVGLSSLAIDPLGNIYLGCQSVIRKINPAGIISTITGVASVNGIPGNGYSGDGGLATAAQVNSVEEMEIDGAGNLIFAEYGNHVVRKISTAGIISTFVGNGTPGFFGDGSIPSMAHLQFPSALAMDATGNLYIGDTWNYRVRKLDFSASPICPTNLNIAKVLGSNGAATINTSVFPAVGNPAYAGQLRGDALLNPMPTIYYSNSNGTYTHTFPGNGIYFIMVTSTDIISGYNCAVTGADTILITNSSTPRSFGRQFQIFDSTFCNAGTPYFRDSSVFQYGYGLPNPSALYTITTNWGNGQTTVDTGTATTPINITSAPTSYTSPGSYTVQSILSGGGVPDDTLITTVNVIPCGNLTGILYHDANNDCAYGNENLVQQTVQLKATDGTNTYLTWSNGGSYTFANIPAGTYTLEVLNNNTGYTTTCATSLPHSTTVLVSQTTFELLPLNCTGGFDIAVSGISLSGGFFPGQSTLILPHVGINNGTCDFVVPGQVRMVLTPCIQYQVGGANTHVPDAIIPAATGDTLVWNVLDLNNIGSYGYWDYAVSVSTCTTAVVGDTACITMMALPTSGDVNPTNNIYTRCFEIGVSFDPNNKEVSPAGIGSAGRIPETTSKLTYTLNFQNTGTAPAFNIYLLDTLSTDFDLNSIEIIAASHAMQPFLLPGGVMKFQFANIQLPDSTSDEPNSHGYVTYKIQLKPGLAIGTEIKNSASIYFDYNAPVLTNTTLNTLGLLTGVNELTDDNLVIYPNPVADKITVRLDKNAPASISISDMLGKEVKRLRTNRIETEIDVVSLSNGIYFITVDQQGKSMRRKFVK